ncbi:MAG: hypothetical protein ACFFFB_07480 [Candidatus Heimdallarchaeota archaeon]
MAISGKSKGKNVNLSKGIIFVFFTIFLIFYGIFMSDFMDIFEENNPGEALPSYLSYIPFVCYVGAIFLGISFIIFLRNITAQKSREVLSRKKVQTGSIYKEALLLTIFIFAFVPLIGPIFDRGENDQNFSIYNDDWNGASDFKYTLEQEGYDIMAIQTSLSATERLNKLNKSILLILLGTNQFYNPINEIPYFINFFKSTVPNSLLICHDHGSTSTLLWEIFIASALDPDIQGALPVTIFPNGILRDNGSYELRPDFPVIESFPGHPTTAGTNPPSTNIDRIILSEASAVVGGPFVTYFGWDVVGSTTDYSYVDVNGDYMYKEVDDYVDLSMISAVIPVFPDRLGLGRAQTVFVAKDTGIGRIFLSADASLFNNELINQPGFDNRQFGINIVNWLTFNHPKEDWVIAFDEAHIRPEYSRDLTSAGIFGFIIQYIIHLSTNPITAWIYPLLAVYTLRKYLPKKDEKAQKKKAKKQEQKEEHERFRTSSYFAQKIEWFRNKNEYSKALKLLYRRLERKLNTQLGDRLISTKNVVDLAIAKEPNISKVKTKRISKFIDRMLSIKEGKSKVKNEQDFENLFFEMEWVVNNI